MTAKRYTRRRYGVYPSSRPVLLAKAAAVAGNFASAAPIPRDDAATVPPEYHKRHDEDRDECNDHDRQCCHHQGLLVLLTALLVHGVIVSATKGLGNLFELEVHAWNVALGVHRRG